MNTDHTDHFGRRSPLGCPIAIAEATPGVPMNGELATEKVERLIHVDNTNALGLQI